MLISRPELLHIDDNLVGINSRLEEMLSLLCMESNDVRMIGIHGIAGIGKTTLAKGIYNQIAHQFEDTSFLSNVAEVEEHRGSLGLQRQLLEDILWKKIARISNIDEGISLIKKTLCSRKVLIILDAVSALTQLESWQGAITGLVQADLPDDRFWELSGHALNYCDGLPLAVKVVGAFLYRKPELEWEDELLKLTTVGDVTVQKVLRLSYDRLDHTEKDLFLDIACFFRGKDSDSVGRILDMQ
ncbi:disease resistance protein RUN1-like [Vitis riparia]|uniref:disease resistance protein RUN1-like n=1 Tax=Vitis riparia TaxID=96939 RepID=UPI00155B3BDB|nr:disease resistance protein RUN1-like [Vitis riparia]